MGELQQPRNKNDPPFIQTMINTKNSKSFANVTEALWNLPYWEFSKTVMDLMVWKCRFAKDMSNKLMTFRSNRKIGGIPLRKKVMSEKNQVLWHR